MNGRRERPSSEAEGITYTKIELFGLPATFADAKAGALFRSSSASGDHFALKIVSPERKGWIVLEPFPAQSKSTLTGGQGPVGSASKPVFELTETKLRPSLDFADWSFDASCGSGGLVLAIDGRAYLCVIIGQNELLLDLDTRQIARTPPDVAVVVRKWSIVQTVDGKPRTLVEFVSRQGKRKTAAATAAE